MRNFILLLLVATLFSCNLFRKVKKESVVTESTLQQGSKSETKDIDTGKVQTSERLNFKWHLYNPNAFNGMNPPAFNPDVIPSSDPSDIKNSLVDIQGQTNSLFGYFGTLEGTLDRFINEQKGKSKETKAADTLSKTDTSNSSTTTKDPVIPWYYLLAGAFGVIIFWDIIKAVFSRLSFKK
jgi:hypothetical protein